jgi:uncharacterized protein YwgA
MPNKPISKLEQYALITYLVGKRSRGLPPGKKALQKLVHLVEELGGVDAGYRFSFYTYGPYASDLTADLDAVAGLGGIVVSYSADENAYSITSGDGKDWVLNQGAEFLKRSREAIDRVVSQFGERLAKDLELVSTIVYLRRHAPELLKADDLLIERVKALKPKYSDFQIKNAIQEIRAFIQ